MEHTMNTGDLRDLRGAITLVTPSRGLRGSLTCTMRSRRALWILLLGTLLLFGAALSQRAPDSAPSAVSVGEIR